MLAQVPTYLNTVSADIGMDLAGRNPDGFAGIQSLSFKVISGTLGSLVSIMMSGYTLYTYV